MLVVWVVVVVAVLLVARSGRKVHVLSVAMSPRAVNTLNAHPPPPSLPAPTSALLRESPLPIRAVLTNPVPLQYTRVGGEGTMAAAAGPGVFWVSSGGRRLLAVLSPGRGTPPPPRLQVGERLVLQGVVLPGQNAPWDEQVQRLTADMRAFVREQPVYLAITFLQSGRPMSPARSPSPGAFTGSTPPVPPARR